VRAPRLYVHQTALGTYYASTSPTREGSAGFWEVWQLFGCTFGDDQHPVGDREDVMAWAASTGREVVEVCA
jgi:hypothetical protein